MTEDLAADLRMRSGDSATVVPGGVALPEPVVKQLLADLGIRVPVGEVHSPGFAAASFDGPLVLKAFGPGIVHKSDVGAVRLGLSRDDVPAASVEMAGVLQEHDLTPAGFLVEQQVAFDCELIVGVVRDPSFGHLVLLGLGGVATEMLDLAALRVAPLTERDAEELVSSFPGAGLLEGARGGRAADRSALVDLLLRLAGPEGLVARLGSALHEFECNPLAIGEDGSVALDARLILGDDKDVQDCSQERTDFTRLFRPRAVAVAGASSSGRGFGNRFLAAFRDMGRTDDISALHPRGETIDGVPSVPTIAELPATVDYLVVAVPAESAAELAREAAGRVPFLHVISGGFRENGAAGERLEEQLLEAVAGTDTRILGPNCIGLYSPAGRQAFSLGAPTQPGSVAVVSQSGGLSGDLVAGGAARGIRFSAVVSVGNCLDVDPAELVEWFSEDDATQVIGLYLEGAGEGHRLLRALREVTGRKPVVVMVGGLSRQGSAAVTSHTGSMAAAPRVWDAVARATGITVVPTLEQFLGIMAYLQVHEQRLRSTSRGVLVIGGGGGASVLATDACDRSGLDVIPLADGGRAALRASGLGAGTSVANPIEVPVGPASPAELLPEALERALETQEYGDVLVHLNVAAYFSYGSGGVEPLLACLRQLAARQWSARIAVVARNLDVAPGAAADEVRACCADLSLPMFTSMDEAAVAIAAAQRFAQDAIDRG